MFLQSDSIPSSLEDDVYCLYQQTQQHSEQVLSDTVTIISIVHVLLYLAPISRSLLNKNAITLHLEPGCLSIQTFSPI